MTKLMTDYEVSHGFEPRSVTELAVAEAQARADGNHEEADRLQARRWESAMGKVINSENTKPRRSTWYRDACAQHELALAAPQAFPLTGDGAETEKLHPPLLTGLDLPPVRKPPSASELSRARYRDWLASSRWGRS